MRITHKFWLFLLVLAPLAAKCDKGTGVTKFVSDKQGQSYFELRDGSGLHRVYSREADGSAVILVLDKKNVPEAVALISDEKAYVMEYRPERGVPPAGLKLLDASYMGGISSRDPAFSQWRGRLAVFKVSGERRSKTFKFAKQGQEPVSIQVDDNGISVAALAECRLDVTTSAGFRCAQSEVCICGAKALCEAFKCFILVDRLCFLDNLNKWLVCNSLGTYEQGEGGDEGSLKDVGVDKVGGVYNLSY